ncbi:MGH1-like glycoside hydrolase domain-containing protein [Sinorhizobium meliloti]|uniref:MGH1-like glycoside hydrolase domain-containing protein n=1 Tax=Rhizobium meliloti TaxID=382 RepID=UPI000FD78160|nr:trehalase family glycosidase [Sinorhizobium meliloti]RVN54037.1 glycoside hydrolase family 37 [Sinorhizobium meliloti]
MLKHATVPIERAWNTWSDRPAEMVFLPLGVRVTPILYSTRTRTTSAIEPRRDAVRLGRHAIDGSLIELETDHAGTTLAFLWDKTDPFAIRGEWHGKASGEWGLRFWIALAISSEGGESVQYRVDDGVALLKVGTRYVAVASADAPVQVTGHDDLDALRADFETNGYFYLGSRSNDAPVLALRFNLEMMRHGAYAAAVADSAELAIEKARAELARKTAAGRADDYAGLYAGSLDAIRDVVAWNTIWDATNARPYTAVTRIWNLGKFAVWYNDQIFAAQLAGTFDADLARENLAAALAGATPQGNIACIVTSNDAWVDRSQPPHGALAVWQLYQRTGERSLLEANYLALARNQRWWRKSRDPEMRGLLSCGTSDVGEALYKGTAFGARNETGMDNSPTHDEAIYDPETRTLSTFDLGLNCAAALDAEMLARMAQILGHAEDAIEFAGIAESSRRLIREELWDDSRKIFANRQRSGGFVRSLSPTSFYPLFCGAASDEQAAFLLQHLADERTFAGTFGLPNVTRDDPAFADNVYWRGRIWPNVNYMVWLGLRRYGFYAEATRLAEMSHALFMKSWHQDRIAAENYNATTGEAMDQGDTDPFYIWAALLPLMAVGEVVDFDPWKGWEIRNPGRDTTIGPMLSPMGELRIRVENELLTLELGGKPRLATDLRARLSNLAFWPCGLSCVIGATDAAGSIRIVDVEALSVVAVRMDGADARWSRVGGDLQIEVGPARVARTLEVHFSTARNAPS